MPIARLYETEQQAHDAAQKLSSSNAGGSIHVITPTSGGDAVAELTGAGVDAGDAAAYAAAVAGGKSVVTASAPFGQGVVVKSVLDEFNPVPMALPSKRREASSRYTPFSEALALNLLTNRTQVMGFWGRELKRPDVTRFGFPRLQRNYNLSFGIARLNRKYNWSFGIPRLQRNYNLSFGIPRIQRNYNWSFGIPRLIHR
ncbi:MAG: hypothetical protein AAF184_03360 [Pseudomonadota bacterium]